MATEGINETLIANAIGAGGGSSDDIRKKLILAMLQEGTSGAPVAHFTQGLDRVAKAMLGGLEMRDLDRLDREQMALEREYWRSKIGGGGTGPGSMPGTAGVDSGPRPANAPSLTQGGPPMPPMDEPARPPPGTFPTPRNLTSQNMTAIDGWPVRDPAQIAQALGGGGGVNLANVPGGPGSPEDMGPPLRPPSGAAALAVPMPPPTDPTMALTPPTGPAGALPPQMGPGSMAPPSPQRPLTPPAPRAVPVGPPGTTPEQDAKTLHLLQSKRTSPAVRAQIMQDLIPKTEVKELIDPATGEKASFWVNPRTRRVDRIDVPPEPRDQASVIPPAPPGVDPKTWREAQSKRFTEEALPATDENVMKLRKEVQDLPSYKNIAAAAPVYRSMRDAAGRDDRASDVNLIYGMAKLMDPGSVVRESEMTVAQAIATLPQGLAAQIKSQLAQTGRLDADVRAGIMRESYSRIQAYQYMFDQDAGMYRDIAKSSRMRESHVVPSFGKLEPWAPPRAQGGGAAQPSLQDMYDEARKRGLVR